MRDKDGLTTCMWACRMDNIKHFELLCQSEYNVAEHDGIERDVNGRTWMHWAVRRTEPLECLQVRLFWWCILKIHKFLFVFEHDLDDEKYGFAKI